MDSNGFKIEMLKNNADEVLRACEDQIERGLTACGLMAEKYARDNIRKNGTIDSSDLIERLDSKVINNHSKHEVEIGSNQKYAIYIEYGTGIYSTKGGRRTPWWWKGESKKWAGWHLTRGMKPKPFLKPALANHKEQYIKALEKYLKGMI